MTNATNTNLTTWTLTDYCRNLEGAAHEQTRREMQDAAYGCETEELAIETAELVLRERGYCRGDGSHDVDYTLSREEASL